MAQKANLSGRVFGRLRAETALQGSPLYWLCVCACGNLTSVVSSSLLAGRVRSCGCLRNMSGVRKGRLQGSRRGLARKETEFKKQRGICALCGDALNSDFRKSYWDHNHSTAQFRGLVHPRCNTVLGFVETCPELVEKAKRYINDKK